FFPQQDTGFMLGIAEAAQDSSFAAMSERATRVADAVRQDPAVESVGFTLGSTTFNNSNFFIMLKPKESGRTATADEVIGRLRGRLAEIPGVNLYLRSASVRSCNIAPSSTPTMWCSRCRPDSSAIRTCSTVST